MQEFWIRIVSIMMIVGILIGYNAKLEDRSKAEEIARLNAMIVEAKEEENASQYKDGIYEGEAYGFGDIISVKVTVADGAIAQIDIISAAGEDGAYLSMAQKVIEDIVESQSTQVDTVSGATFSSTGIIDAVKQALEQAEE